MEESLPGIGGWDQKKLEYRFDKVQILLEEMRAVDDETKKK